MPGKKKKKTNTGPAEGAEPTLADSGAVDAEFDTKSDTKSEGKKITHAELKEKLETGVEGVATDMSNMMDALQLGKPGAGGDKLTKEQIMQMLAMRGIGTAPGGEEKKAHKFWNTQPVIQPGTVNTPLTATFSCAVIKPWLVWCRC